MQSNGWIPSRVAQVIAVDRHGAALCGAGYLLTGTAVLTAWHIVADAAVITCTFDAGMATMWTVTGTRADRLGDWDLATISIDESVDVEQPAIGTFGDVGVIIDGMAAGFPRWKLRREDGFEPVDGDGAPKYRVMAQVPATITAGSNRRDGAIELIVPPPAPDPDHPDRSPWEGMSGGPVFCQGVLVGVVTSHHKREGLGRLAACRLDAVLDVLTSRGIADLGRAPWPMIAGRYRHLDIPNLALTWSAYREQLQDIAPPDGLRDREVELQAMAEFCAGDEPYMYWEGRPWAGKTALMATFALHPPAGVVVVPFFITARFAGQTDSTAFTVALLDQFSALTGEEMPHGSPSVLDAHRRRLLRATTAALHRRSLRLVLLIDGLDEDTGARPGSGMPSIASLLPRDCRDGLRVIVSGRPHPDLPTDLDLDHPLRGCTHRMLHPSSHASRIAERAQFELGELLARIPEPLHRNIVGLIAASGGGLALGDLEDLTGRPRYAIAALLGSVFGRTIGGRADPLSTAQQSVYMFAHETLKQQAETSLGPNEIEKHRMRIHHWAEQYQIAGWPESTPRYLLTGYQQMLDAAHDADRLTVLAQDDRRHSRMLDHTGGDHAAYGEIEAAIRRSAEQPDPDLRTLVRLAQRRLVIRRRNVHIPDRLPALWALLGKPHRGEGLARSSPDLGKQGRALAALAAVVAGGDAVRAEQIVASIADAEWRSNGAIDIARTIAARDVVHAESIAAAIPDVSRRSRAYAAIADSIADRDPERAERYLADLAYSADRDSAMTSVAVATAPRDAGRAQAMIYTIADDGRRAAGLARLWSALQQLAPADAQTCIEEAKHLALGLVDAGRSCEPLLTIAEVIAEHAPREALTFLRSINDLSQRAVCLAQLASMLARRAPSEAKVAIDEAEKLRRLIRSPAVRSRVSVLLAPPSAALDASDARQMMRSGGNFESVDVSVAIMIATDTPDVAEQIALAATNPVARAAALVGVALALAPVDLERSIRLAHMAEETSRGAVDVSEEERSLVTVVQAIVEYDPERARRLLWTITDPRRRHEVRSAIAKAEALAMERTAANDPVQAEQLALAIADAKQRERAIGTVAIALAAVAPERAVDLAMAITDVHPRNDTLAAVAKRLVATAPDLAARAATSVTDLPVKSDILMAVVVTLLETRPDRAIKVAASIPITVVKQRTMALVAAKLAEREPDTALQILASEIESPVTRGLAAAEVARVVAATDLGQALRIADNIGPQNGRDRAFGNIATVLVAHDPSQAWTLAGQISDATARVQALVAVLHGIGDRDRSLAERLVLAVGDALLRVRLLTELATAAASQDRPWSNHLRALAGSAAEVIDDSQEKRQFRTLIQQFDADERRRNAGPPPRPNGPERDPAAVREWLQDVTQASRGPIEHSRALAEAARDVAPGDIDSALWIAEKIEHLQTRHELLEWLALMVAVEHPRRAEQIARLIVDRVRRTRAMAGVARAVAITAPTTAERIALDLWPSSEQVQALLAIAESACKTASGRPFARRLVATTLLLSTDWSVCARVMGQLDRSLLAEIVDDLCESRRA
ncbi:hypothetical protein AB0K00_26925 [Dactylosporangium sp. NPDC049525]|uniref:hypothetical protein n=1 Tax=Dactylosporangium sp. NPDC049525 TaxID=3154730 RepID=UPI0034392F4A